MLIYSVKMKSIEKSCLLNSPSLYKLMKRRKKKKKKWHIIPALLLFSLSDGDR